MVSQGLKRHQRGDFPPSGFLTFVILVAHDLAAAIVKADGQAGAVRLHVAFGAGIPVDARDSSVHIVQKAHCHLYLQYGEGGRDVCPIYGNRGNWTGCG